MKEKSTNQSILKELMSSSRRSRFPQDFDYIVLYTFLYKYCSDVIKDYLLLELKDKELTIDEAYHNTEYNKLLRFDSLKLNGFYIEKSEVFIEEVVTNYHSKPGFLREFLSIFPENVVFNHEYHNIEYFDDFFKLIRSIDIRQFNTSMLKKIGELINLISQLNVYGDDFEFKDVFNIVSASRMMHINSNPEFVNQILSNLILCEKKTVENAYDPFIKDGNSIMKLYDEIGYDLRNFYGKDTNTLNYFFNIVKLFINDFSLNNVFLKREDGMDSIDINGASFDAILSRIPISIKNYYSSNVNQSREIAKRNKRSEVENLLLEKLDIDEDSFKQNNELNEALENLVEKIGFENDAMDFTGQYESLYDSEFLFLLNLIDSLKEDGIMAISISENFLFKTSLETLRKYLTFEKNYIDTIIRIPNEMIRSKPEVVIVFRKDKSDKDILFIDMSSDYETQKSRLTYSGLFRKNLILDDDTISKMDNVFLNKLTLPKFSNLISIEEIRSNNFNLSVSRYVDTFEGEFISLDEVISEKQEIDAKINDLNSKIEKMMDDLNISF